MNDFIRTFKLKQKAEEDFMEAFVDLMNRYGGVVGSVASALVNNDVASEEELDSLAEKIANENKKQNKL